MKKSEDIAALNKKIETFQKKVKEKREIRAFRTVRQETAATGFQMSIELVSAVFIGAAIGFFLDYIFDTRPIFLSIFIIFGGMAGILNIYKSSKEKYKE